MRKPPAICLWTMTPTHHQSAFLQALRDAGTDLVVRYWRPLPATRRALGWEQPAMPPGEQMVAPCLASLYAVPEWRDLVHVVPGIGNRFSALLAVTLSVKRLRWVHWSERPRERDTLQARLRDALYRLYGRLIARRALGALAIGEMTAECFRQWGVPDRKIAAVPYAIAPLDADAEPDPEAARFVGDRCTFVFCGSLSSTKGTDILIRAFAEVAAQHPQSVLCLVGPDRSGGEYPALARKLLSADQVLMTGAVNADRVARFYALAHVVVLPSRYDGWGVVVNEALSMGKAVVASSAVGAASACIVPGGNGFIVPPEDPAALAEALGAYLRNPELATLHGAVSQARWELFTPAASAKRMLDAIGGWLAAATGERAS
jgi:glycosyltransferase involved in cell wall biosynthesis